MNIASLNTNKELRNSKLKEQHKILYEIALLFHTIDTRHNPGIASTVNYPNSIFDIDRMRQILLQDKVVHDLVAYLLLNQTLPDKQRYPEHIIEVSRDTPCNNLVSKHSFGECKRIQIDLQTLKLSKFTPLRFTRDSSGKQPFFEIYQQDLKKKINESKSYNEAILRKSGSYIIPASTFYIHYPAYQKQVVCFGQNNNSSLGKLAKDVDINQIE